MAGAVSLIYTRPLSGANRPRRHERRKQRHVGMSCYILCINIISFISSIIIHKQ